MVLQNTGGNKMKTVYVLESLTDGTLFKNAVKAHHIPKCDNVYYCNYKFASRDYLTWIIIDINTGLILHMNNDIATMLKDFETSNTLEMLKEMRLNDPTYQAKVKLYDSALIADETIRWG